MISISTKKKKSLYIPYYVLYPNSQWKDIILDGEISKYKVSNEGIIVSFIHKKDKILKGHKMKQGYIIYCLKHNNKDYWVLGHRLVALAFIPKPDYLKDYDFSELEVNHIKGDYENKSNNNVNNLEWTTSSENKYHAYRTKLKADGEDHYNAIYTSSQIHQVCYLLERNQLSRMEIVKETGVGDETVGDILAGKIWKSISKYYNFKNRTKKHTLYPQSTIDNCIKLLQEKKDNKNQLSFADIGRKVSMSRTSVWYLYDKYFKEK